MLEAGGIVPLPRGGDEHGAGTQTKESERNGEKSKGSLGAEADLDGTSLAGPLNVLSFRTLGASSLGPIFVAMSRGFVENGEADVAIGTLRRLGLLSKGVIV